MALTEKLHHNKTLESRKSKIYIIKLAHILIKIAKSLHIYCLRSDMCMYLALHRIFDSTLKNCNEMLNT